MSAENETLADIESEIRARAGAWPDEKLKEYDLRLADRIREAAKRECGDAAAMREALVKIEKMAHCDLCNVYPKYRDKFNDMIGGIEREARAALKTKEQYEPRNRN